MKSSVLETMAGESGGGTFGFRWFELLRKKAAAGNFFFRKDYDYADATVRVGEALGAATELSAVALEAEAFLVATIRPGWVDFFRADATAAMGFSPVSEESFSAIFDEKYAALVGSVFQNRKDGTVLAVGDGFGASSIADAAEFGIGAVVPTFSHGRINALLVVGRKRSGGRFHPRDVNLLKILSCQIGSAVENVALREEAKCRTEEMEQRVAERTERMKNMHDAQSKFLADLSHEFQTPLTILKMNVEAFAKGSAVERKKATYVMETTLDRLSRLTRGLVDIARFDSFKEAFQGRRVDLVDLLQETCDDCSILAKDRSVALSLEESSGFVLGDRDKLKEVLLNLVSNALKHTAAGGLVVLSARRGEGEVEVVVADSGKGIPSKNLPLIFERFYRINDGVSEGAGLGLHLCRKIVEAHGGTIVAESSMGQGSRFVIHLPIVEEVESRT